MHREPCALRAVVSFLAASRKVLENLARRSCGPLCAAWHTTQPRSCRLPYVKAAGVTALPTSEEDGEEGDGDGTSQRDPELFQVGPKLLSPASEDTAVLQMRAWAPICSAASRAVQDQVAGLRSVRWPGASCLFGNGTWCNIYVGWAAKRVDASNGALTFPPPMMTELVPPTEQNVLPAPRPPPVGQHGGAGEEEEEQ